MSEFIEITFFSDRVSNTMSWALNISFFSTFLRYITDSFVCPGEKLIYFFKINPLKTDTS